MAICNIAGGHGRWLWTITGPATGPTRRYQVCGECGAERPDRYGHTGGCCVRYD